MPKTITCVFLLAAFAAACADESTQNVAPDTGVSDISSPDGTSQDASLEDADVASGPSAGPACPEPAQGPIDEAWPEVFVGVEGCDDAGAGSREVPFCSFGRAFEVADQAPYIMTVLDGTYRLVDLMSEGAKVRAGTAEAYFVIRADEGAAPVLLGSRALDGADFGDAGDGLVRVDVSALPAGPRGMWTAGGERMLHVMEMVEGTRSHAGIADLVEPGTWTKADASGAGCADENAGCYIYLRPPAGMDVGATDFEVSQRSFFYAGASDYMVLRGLTFKFTHSTSVFFEGADHLLIEDNLFAHNANSNDNAYSLRIWNTNGTIVRNNRVTDSRYWGGTSNSWGITFMTSGESAPSWVCGNEIWDIIGTGVGSKGGASNIHVVDNYFHDLGTGIEIPNSRCHWKGCDEILWKGGGWTIRENLFVRVDSGVGVRAVYDRPESIEQSLVYNNLFVDAARGVVIPRNMHEPAPVVRNNIFTSSDGSGAGIYFTAGGETTWPDYWLEHGFDSDYNHFNVQHPVYTRANWSGTEEGYTLDAYRAAYAGEEHSTAGEPALLGDEPDWTLPADSPLLGAGDPSVYPGVESVNIGHLPRR